jgi:hypothetical protein
VATTTDREKEPRTLTYPIDKLPPIYPDTFLRDELRPSI